MEEITKFNSDQQFRLRVSVDSMLSEYIDSLVLCSLGIQDRNKQNSEMNNNSKSTPILHNYR